LLGVIVFVFAIFFRPWQQIAEPPENAIKLLAYQGGILYIRAASGNLFAYGTSDSKWKSVGQVNPQASSYECNLRQFSTPRPPGRIVSQLETHPCVEDATSQVNHILLEDGSIWKWEETTGELDVLLVPAGVVVAVIGGALGVVAGLLIGLVTWKLKKK
jgi:hypothetical protein